MANPFRHTKLTKKKSPTSSKINKSTVCKIKITKSRIDEYKKGADKSLTIDIKDESGRSAMFVNIRFMKDNEWQDKGLKLIRDIVEFTGVEFDGENAKVFEEQEIIAALKVTPKEDGNPRVFINRIFSQNKYTVEEMTKILESSSLEVGEDDLLIDWIDKLTEEDCEGNKTSTFDYFDKEYEKDEPVIFVPKQKKSSDEIMKERIAKAGGKTSQTPFAGGKSNDPFAKDKKTETEKPTTDTRDTFPF